MKQVQSIVDRLVQRLARKAPTASATGSTKQPTEFDARTLKQVAGGNGSAQLPTKGW